MFAPYTGPMRQALEGVKVRPPRLPVWSANSLAQFPRDPGAIRDLVLRHLVEPVRFRALTEVLYESGIRAFVQVGQGSLAGFVADTLGGRDHIAMATAVPTHDGIAQLRRAAAALWAEGLSPRLDRLTPRRTRADLSAALLPPAGGGKSMRLRLGGEIVRLAGAVQPVTMADSGVAGLAEQGGPVLSELNALLAETTAIATSVVAATSAPRGAPAGEMAIEREFSLRTMPDIRDHCMFPQPEGWPDEEDLFPIVPMTTLLELMGDAALTLAPGRVVIGFQQVRAMRWLCCAPATHTVVRAVSAGEDRVRVTIEGYASSYVLLSDGYPAAPPPDTRPLRDQRAAPVSAAELYAGGWMFHGRRFAGVASIGAIADDGIVGSLLSLQARGALLDSAGQLLGHWIQVSRTVDQIVLPTGIGTVRLYGPQPPAGQLLDCTGWIRDVTDTEMRADAELRAGGRVWCRIEGWATRRFATDDTIWQVKLHPERNALSRSVPGGWTVVRERWPDPATRELIMRSYLNTAERAEYKRLHPLAQRRWLLGRIAAKDAVRRWLWDQGAGAIYPAELTVAETETDAGAGVRVRGPFRAPTVSFAVSSEGTCAAAIAEDSRAAFSISVEDDDTVLITEPGHPVLRIRSFQTPKG
jgi:hypothetical protein